MDNMDRLNLKKMIKTNDVEDCTNEIRSKKHSELIRKDVACMVKLKKEYGNGNVNDAKLDEMVVAH